MKYTPGPFIGEMSGKLGSSVASHNRNGAYIRSKVIPINSRTLPQIAARNNLDAASANWRNLTDAQRAAWIAQATGIFLTDRLGRTYQPSGQQWYVSCCRNSFVYDPAAALLTAPAAYDPPSALLSATITATAA